MSPCAQVWVFMYMYLAVLSEGRFLSHSRKNSEMRQGGQESKVRIYLRESMLSREEQAVSGEQLHWVSSASWFVRRRNEGVEYSLGREGVGSYSLIFLPAPPSRGEEGFLSLFSLDQKCHDIGAWWVLLICKANFIVMRAYWAKGYIQTLEIPAFPHLPLSPGHLSPPRCVVSCQSGGSCFSLSAQGPPLFSRCMVSCHLAPAPLSLLVSS